MNYQVIARKYRPKRFSDVVGQRAIVTTLRNALLFKRVASAYLFSGARGTGKTTLARLFAKALNCLQPSSQYEPCSSCPSCQDIGSSHSIDVLEIDGASHRGIEHIRQLKDTVGYAPSQGKYKVYLIDEVHMLTKEAFNALLKTLEEPPAHVIFLFATTEAHKIPGTILSRCQCFQLARLSPAEIEQKLDLICKDLALTAEPSALSLIASLAEGSLRDAESILDQVTVSMADLLTVEHITHVLGLIERDFLFHFDAAGPKQEYAAAFTLIDQIFRSGSNLSYFLETMVEHYRTLLLLKVGDTPSLLPALQQKYLPLLSIYNETQLFEILDLLVKAQQEIKIVPSQRIFLEMLLLNILRTHQKLSIEMLVARLVDLEKRLGPQVASLPPQHPEEQTPSPPEMDPSKRGPEIEPNKRPFPEIQPERAPPEIKPLKPAEKPAPTPDPERRSPPPKKEPEKRAPDKIDPERNPPEKRALQPIAPLSEQKDSIQKQSHYDTIMRFAEKELNGSLKKS